MTTGAEPAVPYDGLIRSLAGSCAQPLWDRYHLITTRQPASAVAAHCWSWQAMAPLVQRAVDEVSMEDAERRVLLLSRPDHSGSEETLRNISGGLQVLMPGEVARAHRHALAALRFVMEGQGAITTVNGMACEMLPGDLVLTPSMAWHEHTHPGRGRMVWFDGLDLPLSHHLDSMFFELYAPQLPLHSTPSTPPAVAPHDGAVLGPDVPGHYRFAGARAKEALATTAARRDGSRLLRYVDAAHGGAVMPTLDCYLLGLPTGTPTIRRRSTASALCVVASGHGVSTIGGTSLHWQRNDVFTIPQWQWVSHCASTADARLFLMTDRELLATMRYLREEEDPT